MLVAMQHVGRLFSFIRRGSQLFYYNLYLQLLPSLPYIYLSFRKPKCKNALDTLSFQPAQENLGAAMFWCLDVVVVRRVSGSVFPWQ